MVGVVVGDEQNRTQVGLPIVAGRDGGEEIEIRPLDQLSQFLAIGLEVVDAPAPGESVRRCRIFRPVVVWPREVVDVLVVRTEVEKIFLGEAEVLEQLPWRVFEPSRACSLYLWRD